jgi:hypothetical protein
MERSSSCGGGRRRKNWYHVYYSRTLHLLLPSPPYQPRDDLQPDEYPNDDADRPDVYPLGILLPPDDAPPPADDLTHRLDVVLSFERCFARWMPDCLGQFDLRDSTEEVGEAHFG